MYVYPKMIPQLPEPITKNPTDAQRHEMLYNSLNKVGRLDDYENIISLLAPPNDTDNYMAGEFKGIKVGIIGGGLAGMSAAFELRKLGYDITIIEPNTERIGGRVYTYYFDKEKKLYGELGAMRIPISHETVWHYINLFKLNTEPFINADPNTFTYVRNVRVRNDPNGENIFHNIYPLFDLTTQEANTPWPKLIRQVSEYYLSKIPTKIRKQLIMVLPSYDYRVESALNVSIREALEQYGLSDEAINLFISVIPLVGATIYNAFGHYLIDNYTLDFLNQYRISGGMVNLPLAFYKSLTSPSPVEYPNIPQNALGKITWMGGYHVYGIYKSDTDGKVVLRYGLTTEPIDTRDIYETFDYVICALPMAFLREMDIQPLFSGRKMEAIRDVRYEDAQKTLFLCKERFWEKQGIFGGSSYTDKIIEIITYPSDHTHCIKQNVADCSPNEPGVLLASYNTSIDAVRLGMTSPENRYPIIRDNVEKVHGLPKGYLNNIVMDFKTVDWLKENWAKGAFQMLLPGQRKDFLYVSSTPEYNNRVFFAGEHTSSKNSWTQGALYSGLSAAADVAYYSTIHKYEK